MLKKKHALSGVLTILILTSCGKTNAPRTLVFDDTLPPSFLKNNAVQVKANRFSGYTNYEKFRDYEAVGGVLSLNYQGNYTVSYSIKQTYAVFSVENGGERLYGVYDFKTRSEVLPAEYDNILLIEAKYYNGNSDEEIPYVFAVLREDDRFGLRRRHTLFNLKDKVEVVSYENTSITPLYLVTTERVGNHTVETITERPYTSSAWTTTNKVVFDIKGVLTRREIFVNESKIIVPEKTYITESPSLVDYSYEFLDTKIIGYKGEAKVFEVPLPLAPFDTLETEFTFDKYLVLQLTTPVASDTSDYTFFAGGDKYIMTTAMIDLTNGKVTNLKKFPYFINSSFNGGKVYLQKDANMKKTLGILEISKVEDKVLLAPNLVLFNSEMKPLVNLTTLNYHPTFYDLGNNLFLTAYGEIVDQNHQKLLDLSAYSNIQYVPGHGLISLRYNGRYGLINPRGDIIVPFEYQSPFVFYNGYALNENNVTSRSEKISTTGIALNFGTSLTPVSGTPGLLYRSYGGGTSYYNYFETLLFTIEDDYETRWESFVYHENGEIFGKLYLIHNDDGTVDNFIIY